MLPHNADPTPVAPSSQYDAPPPAYSDLPPAYNAFADAPNNAGDGGAGAPAAAGVFCPTTGTIT